eukprot:gene8017-10706_t
MDGTATAQRREAPALVDHADLSTFFDVTLDMLVIRDLDGIVLKVSRSWETHLGWRAEELEGTPLLGLVHPDDMPGTLMSVVE